MSKIILTGDRQPAAFMLDIMLVHYPSVFVYRTPAYMMKFIL